MDLSQLCEQQRAKERKALNFYIACGLTSSILVHFLVFNSFYWLQIREQESKLNPIEFVVLDTPKEQEKLVKEEKKVEQEKEQEIVKDNTPVSQPRTPTAVKKPVNKSRTSQQRIQDRQTPKKSTNQQRNRLTFKKNKINTSNRNILQQSSGENELPSSYLTSPQGINFNSNSNQQQTSNGPYSSNTTQTNTVSTNTGNVQQGKPKRKSRPTLRCISNCKPKYPSVLNGAEGRATVIVTVDPNGNALRARFAGGSSNFQIIQQAVIAAKKMRFSSPGNVTATVSVNINFSVAGSAFDRQAQQRRAEYEKRRQQRQQAELERQRQQRQQAELERQRQQQRQAQLQRQRQAELERQRQQQGQGQAELERQRKIDEILKRNSQILDRQ